MVSFYDDKCVHRFPESKFWWSRIQNSGSDSFRMSNLQMCYALGCIVTFSYLTVSHTEILFSGKWRCSFLIFCANQFSECWDITIWTAKYVSYHLGNPRKRVLFGHIQSRRKTILEMGRNNIKHGNIYGHVGHVSSQKRLVRK